MFFLALMLNVPAVTAQILIPLAHALDPPFFAWLSDRIGSKPIILAIFALGLITQSCRPLSSPSWQQPATFTPASGIRSRWRDKFIARLKWRRIAPSRKIRTLATLGKRGVFYGP